MLFGKTWSGDSLSIIEWIARSSYGMELPLHPTELGPCLPVIRIDHLFDFIFHFDMIQGYKNAPTKDQHVLFSLTETFFLEA